MKYLIVGGAGFIGSYILDSLLESHVVEEVKIYDNFISGKMWHLERHLGDPRLKIYKNDIYDEVIFEAAEGVDCVIMLAANPDIAKAAIEPEIDFVQGTFLLQRVLEAIRKAGSKRLLYASGSGVYGDVGALEVSEDYGPMLPISTYGASKLACEALISSYCHMFGLKASAFRFGNVVGGRQTHGVAYDFIRRLRNDPTTLAILGDGTQSKPYVHVTDVVSALKIIEADQVKTFDVYNVAPRDFTTVAQIGNMVVDALGIARASCKFEYAGGGRGWKGDVPIVRLNSDKIRQLNWSNRFTSTEAVRVSIDEMLVNQERLYCDA